MLFNYANVLIFAFVGIAFIFFALLVGSFVRPKAPSKEKLSTYECGEEPVGSAWINFNLRFYVIALVFVVFDVEVAFMFPVVKVFKRWIASGQGGLALLEIVVFLSILFFGFVYLWKKGDLDWVKEIRTTDDGRQTMDER